LRAECALRFCDFADLQEVPEGSQVLCGENWSEARIFLQEMKAMTKDPVCGMNVDENNSQYQSEHKGKQYSFCSEQCKNKFDQHPEQYARSAA
jgi:YHS domain-containing protein